MLRHPPWSDFLQVKESRAAENEPKPMCVPGDVEFVAAMGQIIQRGASLLGRWPEWQDRFVQVMVREFGVAEEVLQELRDRRDLENDTLRVPITDTTLQDWEETPVFTDAPGITNNQSKGGRSKSFVPRI